MPARRLSMRKIREVLRLKFRLKLKDRAIARSCSIPRSTVANYVFRAIQAGLTTWPLAPDLNDEALEKLLFPPGAAKVITPRAATPDFAWMHTQLCRHKHLTLQLLWDEYKEVRPEGYQYSQFCELYRRWVRKIDVVLRQEYRAGEKMFVDHAGQTVPVVSRETGEIHHTPIFVAVLGASNYTYAEATWKRDLAAWIGSHNRALAYYGGVPMVTVPDNWKTGVTDACYYEPDLNPTYRDWAAHYDTVVIPARVRKPRDKAKVESGVLVVERWILAALRHHTFFSLGELNEAIQELLVRLNNRTFRKLDTTRAKLFESLEKPMLKPLPSEPFPFVEWKTVRVNIDYHVEINGHYYSVPHQYTHEEVEARISETVIEIMLKGERIATHARSTVAGKHSTQAEHRPAKHQDLEWTIDRFTEKGRAVGPSTALLLEHVMKARKHPELGYRSCLGILRLARRYTNERLEAACRRAITLNACSYRSIKSMLAAGLDRQVLEQPAIPASHQEHHANVRGAAYYGKEVDA
ncbi:MAG TPA: IS21 family transposase [Acidobacteriota bacterium]|nr:IS21 family transposase [Acidobacteriota bacterium]